MVEETIDSSDADYDSYTDMAGRNYKSESPHPGSNSVTGGTVVVNRTFDSEGRISQITTNPPTSPQHFTYTESSGSPYLQRSGTDMDGNGLAANGVSSTDIISETERDMNCPVASGQKSVGSMVTSIRKVAARCCRLLSASSGCALEVLA